MQNVFTALRSLTKIVSEELRFVGMDDIQQLIETKLPSLIMQVVFYFRHGGMTIQQGNFKL
jgi:ABC-type proline/glycine betaine transport system permease subunit